MKTRGVVLIIAFTFAKVISAQPFDVILAAKLQNTIDSLQISHNIKGISASVIYPGQGMWQGVTGDSHAGTPISKDMVFGLGSNTKLFTAVIMLKLVQSNIVNMDDSLHDWLPNFNNIDSNITVRQLLNHTTGLADVNSVVGYADSILLNPNKVYTPSEVMTWVGTPLFSPGTSWGYSNTNYLLAGMIIESATGKNFGQVLHDSILSPLQLDSTFLGVYDIISGTVAHPWQSGADKNSIPRIALNSVARSAGGMYSTSGEMAQWYQALMSGQVLNPVGFNEMTTFVGTANYGCGIVEMAMNGSTVWEHGGTIWGGYNTQMIYDTTSGVIICVLINANPASAFNVGKQLHLITLNNPVGIKEFNPGVDNYEIYSNPVHDVLSIKSSGSKSTPANVEILSPLGEVVLKTNLMQVSLNRVYSVDMSELKSGIYFLKLTSSNNRVETRKIIKE